MCLQSTPWVFQAGGFKGETGEHHHDTHFFLNGTEGYLFLQAMCINMYFMVTESFTSLLLDVQTTLIYLIYLALINSDRCICVYVTQRNLQSSLSQPFWKANRGNYIPHSQQITSTTDCVHNTTDPRLAVSISALYATHTPSETDIYLILDSLSCVQYLCRSKNTSTGYGLDD